jgi:hypothetical protein
MRHVMRAQTCGFAVTSVDRGVLDRARVPHLAKKLQRL